MGRSEVSTSVVKWSEGLSNRISIITRRFTDLWGLLFISLFHLPHFFRILLFLFCIIVRFVRFCLILKITYSFCYIVYYYCYVMYYYRYIYAFLCLCLCVLTVMYVPFWVFCFMVLFCVLLLCNCVLYYSHRVPIQLQLTNISSSSSSSKNKWQWDRPKKQLTTKRGENTQGQKQNRSPRTDTYCWNFLNFPLLYLPTKGR